MVISQKITTGIHRFTLRELLECSDISFLTNQLGIRAQLQLNTLSSLPRTRQSGILHNLYRDSIDSATNIRSKCSGMGLSDARRREVGQHLAALCARHGGVIETLSDLYLNPQICNRLGNEELVYRMLQAHVSLTAVLEELTAEYSSKYAGFVASESPSKLCHDAKLNAISLAEHQENWSPLIDVFDIYNRDVLMIPSRVQFCILEGFKNALASTIKAHSHIVSTLLSQGKDVTELIDKLPTVCATVSEDPHAVLVAVVDKGVGLDPTMSWEHSYRFLYSSTQHAR
jgi:hypothetical protein